MHVHGPNLLQGPVSRLRGWWISSDEDIMEAMTRLPSSQDPCRSSPAGKRPPADAPIRKELVERVRREIAQGTYDTPEKWNAALDNLSKRLEEE